MRPKHFIFVLLLHFLSLGISTGNEDPFAKWPDGWEISYQRFQQFIEAREKFWPSSDIKIGQDGTVSFTDPKLDDPSSSCGFHIYRNGYADLACRPCTPFKFTDKHTTEQEYAICINGYSKLGYQHYPPILWVRVSKSNDGQKQCIPFQPDHEEDRWPNWRGLSFKDFNAMKPPSHSLNIHETNRRVNPTISLKIDHQAQIHHEKFPSAVNNKSLHWRIYHNGKRVKQINASGNSPSNGNFGSGHYLIFLAVNGPHGYMPVSNYLTYYIYSEKNRSKHSLIAAQDSDKDGMPDFMELRYQLNPNDPSDAPGDSPRDRFSNKLNVTTRMIWEFIPGHFGKLPWVIDSPKAAPVKKR